MNNLILSFLLLAMSLGLFLTQKKNNMSTNQVVVDWAIGNSINPQRHHFTIPRQENQSHKDWLSDVNREITIHWASHEPILEIGQEVLISWEGIDQFKVELDYWIEPPGPSVYWLDLVLQSINNKWQLVPPV